MELGGAWNSRLYHNQQIAYYVGRSPDERSVSADSKREGKLTNECTCSKDKFASDPDGLCKANESMIDLNEVVGRFASGLLDFSETLPLSLRSLSLDCSRASESQRRNKHENCLR